MGVKRPAVVESGGSRGDIDKSAVKWTQSQQSSGQGEQQSSEHEVSSQVDKLGSSQVDKEGSSQVDTKSSVKWTSWQWTRRVATRKTVKWTRRAVARSGRSQQSWDVRGRDW